MRIQDMFKDDIDRKINGVVKVDQDAAEVLAQEVKEYVITRDIHKHMITFFEHYSEAFDTPTADIGVWISGFFGSGKSHFLKILSYLLKNPEIEGRTVEDYFRGKFNDDTEFAPISKAVKGNTDTILFNIDIEGPINKDKTAVLRVFAKMFYNYLGFYGENLKVAKLEQFIDKQGKTEQFRQVFEEKNGDSWIESRDAFAFFEDDIVETMEEVLGMSETAARNWFDGSEEIDTSIAQLVSEMKEYVDQKPDDFRLLFMIDEVGQYVGESIDLLMNLQSLVEEIGVKCNGKVWVMCTGQEAIDEIIKTRQDQFSRIQARFKTRLSLTSSSADEVIQKRILMKKEDVAPYLEEVYEKNESVIGNIFSFKDCLSDIKGYNDAEEYAKNFPFVPYQFQIMQQVFSEIRKHGNSGKHLSGGERSMLSGFQEAAQKIKEKDEHALVPFYLFYDTVHTFLDSSIRRVIDRCEKAGFNHNGIEPQDVNVLKLLYMIRYIDDIKANLDNIMILMTDDFRVDKIKLREQIRESLDRLLRENYIGRTADTYNFLTDEEQDIQREINTTTVDTAAIVERIGHMVFGDIYTTKKYRHDTYDFAFDRMVDDMAVGTITGNMKLKILTLATDETQKNDLMLMKESAKQAVVVLADTPYYDAIEKALKIRKYIKQRDVMKLPKSVQEIIRNHQEEAGESEKAAIGYLEEAIESAQFYVEGEHIEIKSGNAKSKLDQALEYLVSNVYKDLDLVVDHVEDNADLVGILTGTTTNYGMGMNPNQGAMTKIEEYLQMQNQKNLPTSMADVQSRYQAIPYGWREIDIAAICAMLVYDQKVTIKYAGNTIQPDDPKLPDMLRKKSEIGKTEIKIRQAIPVSKMKAIKSFLREYFNVMDVPADEDGLVHFIKDKFEEERDIYKELERRYAGRNYPDHDKVLNAIRFIEHNILSQINDNIALINAVLKREDDLFDLQEDLQEVQEFFKHQVQIFDEAVDLEHKLRNELDYLKEAPSANQALNQLRLITAVKGKFTYDKISELNKLIKQVQEGHNHLLHQKQMDIMETLNQCSAAIQSAGAGNHKVKEILSRADRYFKEKQEQISETTNLALLDSVESQMIKYQDDTCGSIEAMLKPHPVIEAEDTKEAKDSQNTMTVKKNIRSYNRQILFPAKELESEEEIDEYVEKIRKQLKQLIKNYDGIRLK